MKPFCDILKQKRIEQNISRKELSLVTDISLSSLSLYESGKSDPTGPVLIQLARALHTSIDDLVGYSVDPLPEYERYKKYLESIGAKVRVIGNAVMLDLPRDEYKRKTPQVILSKEDFSELSSAIEGAISKKVISARDERFLTLFRDYAKVSNIVYEAVRNEEGIHKNEALRAAYRITCERLEIPVKNIPKVKVVDLWEGE